MDEWEKHLVASASDEKIQRNFAKMVEWYGGKEALIESFKSPPKSEVYTAYQKRIVDIQRRLSKLQGTDVTSFEVKQLIGEYDFVMKQLCLIIIWLDGTANP